MIIMTYFRKGAAWAALVVCLGSLQACNRASAPPAPAANASAPATAETPVPAAATPAPAAPAATPAPQTAPPAAASAPAAPTAAAAPAAGNYDFGDASSQTLTTDAWKALEAKDYAAVAAYTGKCQDLYKDTAIQQQGSLQAPAPKENASQYWALNDVGTCYFIQGKAAENQKDTAGAIAAYQFLVKNLAYAQCWDPKGWFWSPGDTAKQRLTELEFAAAESGSK